MSRDPCEWNPTEDRPAQQGDDVHGYYEVCVGAKGQWHLCMSCAALPRFQRFRARKVLEAAKSGGDGMT